MADFSQNITNAVNCFWGGPSTKWGQSNGYPYTMTWGTSKWGYGESIPYGFIKVITNTQSFTWDYSRSNFRKVFEIGSLVASHDMISQTLKNGDWYYIFTSDTMAGESRSITSWTAASVTDATFTCLAAGGTSWSSGA